MLPLGHLPVAACAGSTTWPSGRAGSRGPWLPAFQDVNASSHVTRDLGRRAPLRPRAVRGGSCPAEDDEHTEAVSDAGAAAAALGAEDRAREDRIASHAPASTSGGESISRSASIRAGRAASVSMSSAQSRTKGGPSAPDMFMFGVGVATATWAIVQLQRALRGNSAAYAAADKKEAVEYFESGETVEWVNMSWRKLWRVYQRGLEKWLGEMLQSVFDMVTSEYTPKWIRRMRIAEFTLDHAAPVFQNMRRRTSRKDSDISGVVDIRYTGGARMLLVLEIGRGRWSFKVPVQVSDLDVEGKLWIKIRLAPMPPWIGTLSVAFVGPPRIRIQLAPYNRIRLMQVPVIQNFLRKLLTVDLPSLMVLPKRLEISVPPSITSLAEAAVGRDTIMRAVASAVLEADALEQALDNVLPLGRQGPAGGVELPESFKGELSVSLREARDLDVPAVPWQSNPYCRLVLGSQVAESKGNNDTGVDRPAMHSSWNQDFEFLVENHETQVLEIYVRDVPISGRTLLGTVRLPLSSLPPDRTVSVWLPIAPAPIAAPEATASRRVGRERSAGELRLELTYTPFTEDDADLGYREAERLAQLVREQIGEITDVKSAAYASSRAAVATSAAVSALAATKAKAARAAARALLSSRKAQAAAAEIRMPRAPPSPSAPGALPAEIERMAESYQNFLQSISEDPDRAGPGMREELAMYGDGQGWGMAGLGEEPPSEADLLRRSQRGGRRAVIPPWVRRPGPGELSAFGVSDVLPTVRVRQNTDASDEEIDSVLRDEIGGAASSSDRALPESGRDASEPTAGAGAGAGSGSGSEATGDAEEASSSSGARWEHSRGAAEDARLPVHAGGTWAGAEQGNGNGAKHAGSHGMSHGGVYGAAHGRGRSLAERMGMGRGGPAGVSVGPRMTASGDEFAGWDGMAGSHPGRPGPGEREGEGEGEEALVVAGASGRTAAEGGVAREVSRGRGAGHGRPGGGSSSGGGDRGAGQAEPGDADSLALREEVVASWMAPGPGEQGVPKEGGSDDKGSGGDEEGGWARDDGRAFWGVEEVGPEGLSKKVGQSPGQLEITLGKEPGGESRVAEAAEGRGGKEGGEGKRGGGGWLGWVGAVGSWAGGLFRRGKREREEGGEGEGSGSDGEASAVAGASGKDGRPSRGRPVSPDRGRGKGGDGAASREKGAAPEGASTGAEGPRQEEEGGPLTRVPVPDVNPEEILRQVWRVMTLKDVRVESMWRRYLQESEKPWLQLLAFLMAVMIVLLCVVAYRLKEAEDFGLIDSEAGRGTMDLLRETAEREKLEKEMRRTKVSTTPTRAMGPGRDRAGATEGQEARGPEGVPPAPNLRV